MFRGVTSPSLRAFKTPFYYLKFTIMKTKHTQGQWVKGTNTSNRDWMQIRCNGKIIADVIRFQN